MAQNSMSASAWYHQLTSELSENPGGLNWSLQHWLI